MGFHSKLDFVIKRKLVSNDLKVYVVKITTSFGFKLTKLWSIEVGQKSGCCIGKPPNPKAKPKKVSFLTMNQSCIGYQFENIR